MKIYLFIIILKNRKNPKHRKNPKNHEKTQLKKPNEKTQSTLVHNMYSLIVLYIDIYIYCSGLAHTTQQDAFL